MSDHTPDDEKRNASAVHRYMTSKLYDDSTEPPPSADEQARWKRLATDGSRRAVESLARKHGNIAGLGEENDRLRADLAEAVALLNRAADLLGDRYTLTEDVRAFLARQEASQ